MSSEQIKHTLVDLYTYMKQNNDDVNSRKILELYHKYEKNEFIISFAGHFSAGKSSMINALLGIDVLPKSPIPTSANIVKLSSGGGYARMYFHEQEPVQYNEPYDMELIRSFCKDKESIHTIEINTADQVLPPQTALYDTPGIDAADDADRLMTEGSLHVADVLFYVMDYNHVQSEVNLTFLHELKEKGIPHYVIINQIDKHNENEIPFELFHEQIEHTFHQWDIAPKRLFYTSLKDPTTSHNMFEEVKRTMHKLFNETDHIHDSIKRSIQEVVTHHEQFLTHTYEDARMQIADRDDYEQHASTYQQLKNDKEQLESSKKSFHKELLKEVNQTVANAQVMPFDMREHARLYLEAKDPSFKVGFIGAKKKTEEERIRREQVFIQALQETAESTIQWNLRDKIKKLSESYGIPHTWIDPLLPELFIACNEELINDRTKRGAQVTGEYVLNYTKDVHSAINALFRKKVRILWDALEPYFAEKIATIDASVKQDEHAFTEAVEQQEALEDMEASFNRKIEHLYEHLNAPSYDPIVEEEMTHAIKNLFHSYTLLEEGDMLSLKESINPADVEDAVDIKPDLQKKQYQLKDTIHAIEQTIQGIEQIPGFNSYTEALLDKKDRLQNRSLTIALFGAFSAGKSSFANALLGEAVLPSSPNPTTAVITKISPVDDKHAHGLVTITLKNEEEVAADLREITKEFKPPAGSFKQLIDWAIEQDLVHNTSLEQMHRAYIHAMIDGYTYMKDHIGKQERIDLTAFATYATDETKACYIKEIDVHYDCSITQKGITLVDTPGADSVNARHTNVSFEYIKEADAILYVTYYNHALSRADKDFLMQLGRVKEAFELDKMFFIINAADLAIDEQELQLVYDYVEEQLLLLGIRFPSIFPISSKQTLEETRSGQENGKSFKAFLHDFYTFLDTELPALTMESAYVDIERTIRALDGYISSAQLDGAAKEERAKELIVIEKSMYEMINGRTTNAYAEQINNRIERQLYYLVERMGIRFHDFFKETFNPTTVTESGRKGQEQVYGCTNALLRYSGYEFLQEIRAIGLRVEAEIKKQLFAHYEETTDRLQEIDDSFILPVMEFRQLHTPAFTEPFTDISYEDFRSDVKYNGMKAFFVQNEREQMRERMYQTLQPHITAYIKHVDDQMRNDYMEQWSASVKENDSMYKRHIQTYVEHQTQMLHDTVDVKAIQQTRNEIHTHMN